MDTFWIIRNGVLCRSYHGASFIRESNRHWLQKLGLDLRILGTSLYIFLHPPFMRLDGACHLGINGEMG